MRTVLDQPFDTGNTSAPVGAEEGGYDSGPPAGRPGTPPALLRYQQRWLADASPVKVWEKSRRIGASWCEAADDALIAAAAHGDDCWYIGYNQQMAREFILDAAMWAGHYQLAASAVEETAIEDEGKDIQAYVIRFASGFRMTALTSRPRNLRGKQGIIVIDEAAFHDDLEGLLKAAIALLIWGGKVRILSTHHGEGNAFNGLCQEIRAGEKPYTLHTTTLDDALAEGLYPRICLVLGQLWSPEAEAEWRADLIRRYGDDSDEELFCRPRKPGGKMFGQDPFRMIDLAPALDRFKRIWRYWDLAGTEPSPDNRDPDYTSGCKMGELIDGPFVLLHYARGQLGPYDVEKLVTEIAATDGRGVKIGLEQDPGQAGKAQAQYLALRLRGYEITIFPKRLSKESAARPLASQTGAGNVLMVRGPWNGPVLKQFREFPGGRHDDDVDSGSGAFGALTGIFTGKRAGPRLAGAWGRR